MTAGQIIDYEALTQEAMRGLVRTVLARAAKSGLPGDHHFYISFDTEAPGVILSKRLKEKYPREMTIVLQHRFWDLFVTEERFEVKLSFDSIPERLVVPYAAIKVFFDPSVRYGLQFEDPNLGPDSEVSSIGGRGDDRPQRPAVVRKPRTGRKTRPDREGDEAAGAGLAAQPASAPAAAAATGGSKPQSGPQSGPQPVANTNGAEKAQRLEPVSDRASATPSANGEKPAGAPGAQIVSLDQFRKK